MLPSGPDMLIWPMRCPVLLPTPAAIISSSRHRVPSKKSRRSPRCGGGYPRSSPRSPECSGSCGGRRNGEADGFLGRPGKAPSPASPYRGAPCPARQRRSTVMPRFPSGPLTSAREDQHKAGAPRWRDPGPRIWDWRPSSQARGPSPKGEGLALTQGEEACHIVDLAARQYHGLDGRIAQPARGGPKPAIRQDLLTQIRRCVDDDPIAAVRRDGDGCLRAGGACSPARAARLTGPLQFHCGTPPPAADPRTRIRKAMSLAATSPAGQPAGKRRYSAQAYALISRPTEIRRIRGVVHFFMRSSFRPVVFCRASTSIANRRPP